MFRFLKITLGEVAVEDLWLTVREGEVFGPATPGAYPSRLPLTPESEQAMHSRQTFTPPRRVLASLWGAKL